MIRLLSFAFLAAACLFISPACGEKKADPAAAGDWLVLHATEIKDVEALTNGYFAVTYAVDGDEPYYKVKGHLEDQIDLKIVKEGLEKLNPPLGLKYEFESD